MPGGTIVGNTVLVAIVYSTVTTGSDLRIRLTARRGCDELVVQSPRGDDAGSRYQVSLVQGVHLSCRSKRSQVNLSQSC